MILDWKKTEYSDDLEWQIELKGYKIDQFIRLSRVPLSANDRGNYHAIFDSYNPLSKLKDHLTTFYFSEAIARLELQSWQKLLANLTVRPPL